MPTIDHHLIKPVWSGLHLGGDSSLLSNSSEGDGYALLEIGVRDGGIQPEDAGMYGCAVFSIGPFGPTITSVTVEIIVLGKLGESL